MSLLPQFIAHLSPEERSNFASYLKRLSGDSLELKLFQRMAKNPDIDRDVLMKALYKTPNRNAFDGVRKRLLTKLKQYVVIQMSDPERSPLGAILSMMMVTEFMMPRRAGEVIQHYLDAGEAMALANHHYDVLDAIYSYHVRHESFLRTPRLELAEKRKANTTRFLKKRNLELANSDIQIELDEAKRKGLVLNPEKIIHDVQKKFRLTDEEVNIPDFQFNLMNMLRNALISTKEYYKLEPVLVKHYNDLKTANAFGNGKTEHELGFLYMIAHVYFRNRKFEMAEEYVERIHRLVKSGRLRETIYYLKYVSLKACIYSYTGRNSMGIQVLLDGLKHTSHGGFLNEQLNMEINLVVFYFQAKDYKRALQRLAWLDQNYYNLMERMGKEWCFKKDLIRLIVTFERWDGLRAQSELDRINRIYRNFLRTPNYLTARMFLKQIGKVVRNPEVVGTTRFRDAVKMSLSAFEQQKHDLQAVTFFIWLRAKIQGRDYYELLVEELNQPAV